MWNLLISNFHSSGNSTSINLLRQQRLQSILLFIYAHYADDLQLSDLAASQQYQRRRNAAGFFKIFFTQLPMDI